MKNIKLIIFLFFMIIISSLCFAVPPFQSTQDSGLIKIDVANNNYYKPEMTFKLHFHVFNSSGNLLTNTTTTCSTHLYNTRGSHIIEYNYNTPYESNLQEWYININSSLIFLEGTYPVLFYCNNSKEAGSHREEFIITNSGFDTNYSNDFMTIIFSFIGLIFVSIFLSINFNHKYKLAKLVYLLFSIICTFIMIFIALFYTRTGDGLNSIKDVFLFLMLPFIIFNGIYWLFVYTGEQIQIKKERRLGK